MQVQGFGFPPLLKGQLLPTVLTIEQIVQAFVHSPWKLKASQISGELELEENLLRHADPFEGRASDPTLHGQPYPHLTQWLDEIDEDPPSSPWHLPLPLASVRDGLALDFSPDGSTWS